MTDIPYHSALATGKLYEADPLPSGVVHFDHRENSVQCWDINNGVIPEEFYECDLIYAEPMWPAGVKNFDERAGVQTPSYPEHCLAVGGIITKLGKPTVMTTSKKMLATLPYPDMVTECDLNGGRAHIGFWHGAFAIGDTNQEIIRHLAAQYDRVGDFCAGYGTTGRLFIEAGKNAVLSDYNASCCGYIAKHMETWG